MNVLIGKYRYVPIEPIPGYRLGTSGKFTEQKYYFAHGLDQGLDHGFNQGLDKDFNQGLDQGLEF